MEDAKKGLGIALGVVAVATATYQGVKHTKNAILKEKHKAVLNEFETPKAIKISEHNYLLSSLVAKEVTKVRVVGLNILDSKTAELFVQGLGKYDILVQEEYLVEIGDVLIIEGHSIIIIDVDEAKEELHIIVEKL